MNDTAYFYVRGISESTSYLWNTDGTAAGTLQVVNSPGTNSQSETANVNGTLFFFAKPSGSPFQLWKIDATSGAATSVHSSVMNSGPFFPSFLGSSGNTVFFVVSDPTLGDQLWRSDGTTAGTFMLRDVNPSPRIPRKDDIVSHSGVILNNRLYFFADSTDSTPYELWGSDGTPQGTGTLFGSDPLAPVPSSNSAIATLNGHVYFRGRDSANRTGLWKTDGTLAGTSLFIEQASPIVTVAGRLYFSTSDGLWATDGTTNGNVFLKKLTVTSSLVQVNGNVFFAANDDVSGNALWKTDGTAGGTVMVKAISGSATGLITSLANVNGTLFFTADDGVTGVELWASNGTEAGTYIADINPGSGSSSPGNFSGVNGHLVFTADDGVHGNELWVGNSTINSPPVAQNSAVSVVQGSLVPVTLTSTDFDNDPHTYTVVSQPLHGTLSGTAPLLTYTAHAGYTGLDSFSFRANDGKQDSNLATVSITVISNAPVANGFGVATKGSKPVNVALTATDPRNLPLTYTVTAGPLHGTLSGTAPNLVYTAALSYVGLDTFTYQASNGQAASNSATVSINVTPNHAPTVPAESPAIFAFDTIPLVLTGEDEDGDPLTYTVLTAPDHGTLSGTPPNLTYTPTAGVNPFVTLTYEASDGEAVSKVGTILIFVLNLKYTVFAEDGAQTIEGTAQDLFTNVPPGGDQSLAFAATADKANLFSEQPAIDSTGTLTFKPLPNSQGTTIVTVIKKNVVTGAFEGEGAPADETAQFVIEIVQKAPWQNDGDPNNVNGDKDKDGKEVVAPDDVLLVIDYINGTGTGEITNTSSQGPFYDADGDNYVAAGDVLCIINWINATLDVVEGEAGNEGNAAVDGLASRNESTASWQLAVRDRGRETELDWLNFVARDVARFSSEAATMGGVGQVRRGRA